MASRAFFFFVLGTLSLLLGLRTQHHDLDFRALYVVGCQWLQGHPHFYPDLHKPLPLFSYKYSPFFPILMAGFGCVSEPHARLMWGVCNAVALLMLWWSAEAFLAQCGMRIKSSARWVSLLLLLDPLATNAIQGNINLLLTSGMMLSLLLVAYGQPRPKQVAGALLLALVSAVKLTPLASTIPLLAQRRWTLLAFTGFFFFFFLVVCPLFFYGLESTLTLYHDWIFVLKDHTHFPFLKYTNQSVSAVGQRLGLSRWGIATLWLGIHIGLVWACVRAVRAKDGASLASLSFLFVLTVPEIVWKEYSVALLCPYLVIHQRLFSGLLPASAWWYWGSRIVGVHLCVPALLGRELAHAFNAAGNQLWGTLLMIPLLLPYPKQK